KIYQYETIFSGGDYEATNIEPRFVCISEGGEAVPLFDKNCNANRYLSNILLTNNSDNVYHIFYHPEGSNLDQTAKLDGIVIVGGNANESSGDHDRGGGMYNVNSSPTIISTIVKGNYAKEYGAGIYNANQSTLAIKNSRLFFNYSGNDGGGIYNSNQSNLTIKASSIGINYANGNGGGIYNNYSSPVVEDTLIFMNYSGSNGGAINNDDNSSPILKATLISRNYAVDDGGGIYNKKSNPMIKDTLILLNKSIGSGGGIYNENSSPILDSSTISRNYSSIVGGAIANNNNSSPLIEVTILNRNFAAQSGGGIYNNNSSFRMINSTMINNYATTDAGGVFSVIHSNDQLSSIIINSIIHGNIRSNELESNLQLVVVIDGDGSYQDRLYYSYVTQPCEISNGCTGRSIIEFDELFALNIIVIPFKGGNHGNDYIASDPLLIDALVIDARPAVTSSTIDGGVYLAVVKDNSDSTDNSYYYKERDEDGSWVSLLDESKVDARPEGSLLKTSDLFGNIYIGQPDMGAIEYRTH
ncbi:MAG: hypothetical protein ACN4E2_06345, partial [Nitrospinota bacterium]